MRIIATIFCLIFGLIYYPINSLYGIVNKWYLPMWHKDKIIYFAFAPFYWILVAIVMIISIPYEAVSNFIN